MKLAAPLALVVVEIKGVSRMVWSKERPTVAPLILSMLLEENDATEPSSTTTEIVPLRKV